MYGLDEKTTNEIKQLHKEYRDVVESWTKSGSKLEKSLASIVTNVANT